MTNVHSRRWLLAGTGAAALGLAVGMRPALGIRHLAVTAPAIQNPGGTWASTWNTWLREHVRGGAVNWERAASPASRKTLETLYRFAGEVGPVTTPERFPDDASQLAWALDAYNLLVAVAVMRHYPITGVGEVRGLLEPKALFGFFYGLRVRIDGRWTHLYGFERQLFRRWPDTRIHAAINCASVSCPPLLPRAFQGRDPDAALDEACRDWLRAEGTVSLRESSREVLFPPLLGLYPEEFAADAKRREWGMRATDWALGWLDEVRELELRARLDAGYRPVIPSYDWGLSRPLSG